MLLPSQLLVGEVDKLRFGLAKVEVTLIFNFLVEALLQVIVHSCALDTS
jgi:hypothetical protein